MTQDAGRDSQAVDRRSGMTQGAFVAQYWRPQKPAIVPDAFDHWPASRRVTPAFFRGPSGSRRVTVDGVDYQLSQLSI